MRLIAQKSGLNLKFINGFTWHELLQKLQAGEIDVLPAVYVTEERQKYIAFTRIYSSQPSVMAVQSGEDAIHVIGDLSGRKVAAIEGFAITDIIKARVPGADIVPVKNVLQGLKKVSLGRADAFIDSIGVTYYVANNNYIPNVKIIEDSELGEISSLNLRMGVAKSNLSLLSILNKSLNSITNEDLNRLNRKYRNITESTNTNEKQLNKALLTKDQREWLKKHSVIKLAPDIAWPPFEWVDDNKQYKGMAADYIRLIEDKLGIKFEVEKEKSWSEVIKAVEDGELDMLSCVVKTSDREKYVSFTNPYLSFPMVVTTRDNMTNTSRGVGITRYRRIEDLNGLRVGVVKDYATHEYLREKELYFLLNTYTTVSEGLSALSQGEIDAFIDNIATVNYIVKKEGLTNIKVAGEMPIRFELSMAVRKDWPELTAIIQQALDSISNEEKQKIYDRWISVRYEHWYDYGFIWKYGTIVFALISFLYFYNRKLYREVRKRAEIQVELQNSHKILLQERHKAEQANQAKSKFLSHMSHELRTPLNAIIGLAELSQYDKTLSTDQRSNAEQIFKAGKHLLELVNDILDLSKIEAGKLELSMESVSVMMLLDECLELASPVAQGHGITLKRDTCSCEHFYINADLIRAKQVLLNLISNAIKYNSENGSVSIYCTRNDSSIRINVADTGAGLSVEQLKKLFLPFSRLGTERSAITGTGIGLVLSKNMAELMGGELGVESVVNEGSTFWVEFKGSVERCLIKESPKESLSVTQSLATGHLLVVEDNQINQNVLSQQLGLLGFTVDIASNGKEGVEKLDSGSYALVLTDLHMPEMNGYEMAQRIRELEEGKSDRIPIIALTADVLNDPERLNRLHEAGIDEYIKKPVELKELERVLSHWVHASRKEKGSVHIDVDYENSPIDMSALYALLGDDVNLHQRILKAFVNLAPDIFKEMSTAYDNNSYEELSATAHKLKSSARSIGANKAADICLELESMKDAEDQKEHIAVLLCELDRQMESIKQYVGDG